MKIVKGETRFAKEGGEVNGSGRVRRPGCFSGRRKYFRLNGVIEERDLRTT